MRPITLLVLFVAGCHAAAPTVVAEPVAQERPPEAPSGDALLHGLGSSLAEENDVELIHTLDAIAAVESVPTQAFGLFAYLCFRGLSVECAHRFADRPGVVMPDVTEKGVLPFDEQEALVIERLAIGEATDAEALMRAAALDQLLCRPKHAQASAETLHARDPSDARAKVAMARLRLAEEDRAGAVDSLVSAGPAHREPAYYELLVGSWIGMLADARRMQVRDDRTEDVEPAVREALVTAPDQSRARVLALMMDEAVLAVRGKSVPGTLATLLGRDRVSAIAMLDGLSVSASYRERVLLARAWRFNEITSLDRAISELAGRQRNGAEEKLLVDIKALRPRAVAATKSKQAGVLQWVPDQTDFFAERPIHKTACGMAGSGGATLVVTTPQHAGNPPAPYTLQQDMTFSIGVDEAILNVETSVR